MIKLTSKYSVPVHPLYFTEKVNPIRFSSDSVDNSSEEADKPNFSLSQRIQNGFQIAKTILKSNCKSYYPRILLITIPIAFFFPPILIIPILEALSVVVHFVRPIFEPRKGDAERYKEWLDQ